MAAQKYAARPGDVFPVEYIVSWEGAPGAYTVLPPQLPVLDWGGAELLEMRSRSSGDRHETRVVVGYRAEEAGVYTAPPLTLRVIAWEEPGESRISAVDENTPTHVLETDAATITIRGSRAGLWAVLIVALLLCAAALLWRKAGNRRLAAATDAALSPSKQAQALLHEARRSRLDGDFYGFYRALCSALECINAGVSDSCRPLHAKLKQSVDDTGYRGVRPSDDAMEGDFKEVERIVAQALQREAKEN